LEARVIKRSRRSDGITADKFITTEDIENSDPRVVYIFGDNLDQEGHGGQAKVARPFVSKGKAFGIPTKRHPGMHDGDFFSDRKDEILFVKKAFGVINLFRTKGKIIVFFPGIGEGLAELPTRSPIIYNMIKKFIKEHEQLKIGD
jgi:hypothetical protein